MAVLREIVFHCTRAPALARFWTEVLDGYQVRPYDDAEIQRLASRGLTPDTDPNVAVDGPGPVLFFTEVPEPEAFTNRVHVDVASIDRRGEVDRLASLGASVQREFDSWTIMRDPEGNEFCITDPR